MIEIRINGRKMRIAEGSSLEDLLERHGRPDQPFAVAVNDSFVARSSYWKVLLREGDRIDLVVATQGG